MGFAVITPVQMRAAEEAAFAHGVTAETLMDEAAAGIARAVSQFFPEAGRCIVFAGKGNNAGDAFAAAELLREVGWAVELRLAFPVAELGDLAGKKLAALEATMRSSPRKLNPRRHLVVLDGLLGLGAKRPLREPIRAACREINALRRDRNAFVFALDLPTGLDAESGETDSDAVRADFTLAIGFVKRGMIADHALDFTGRLEVVSLPSVSVRKSADNEMIVATADALRSLLPRRDFGAYKNQFGRIGVVAGSKGMTGAAVLCSLGALRGGAGLVELFVPEEIYDIVASTAAPEVMVKAVRSYRELAGKSIDVWAIGPGLGRAHSGDIIELIGGSPQPMVLDADALNILADNMHLLRQASGPKLLTPHPGEMKRLFSQKDLSRAEIARAFCEEHETTLLLKGSRTIVAERGHPLSFNTTGNPGMSTGGMGDVLTGVCAALIAQKLTLFDAARVAAWACGRAAELAIFHGGASEQSLLPTDVLANLGRAFQELQSGHAF